MITFAQKMAAAAEAAGLSFDAARNVIYGAYNGYSFAVQANPSNARFCSVCFHVTQDGNALSAAEGKQIAKASNKLVQFVKPAGSAAGSFMVRLGKDEASTAQTLTDALDYLSGSFSDRGFVNACEHCRRQTETEPCAVGNGLRFLCPDCFESVSSELNEKAHAYAETPENVAAGAVGALGGALIGAVVVVIFGRLGYVTALSGLIAAICALKGYELLAKKMSVKGAVISCIAALAMIYVGHRSDWAIEVAQYFDVGFFKAFRAIPMLIEEDVIEQGQYLKGLVMVYLFALLGAVPTVISSLKGQKNKYMVQRLN